MIIRMWHSRAGRSRGRRRTDAWRRRRTKAPIRSRQVRPLQAPPTELLV